MAPQQLQLLDMTENETGNNNRERQSAHQGSVPAGFRSPVPER